MKTLSILILLNYKDTESIENFLCEIQDIMDLNLEEIEQNRLNDIIDMFDKIIEEVK